MPADSSAIDNALVAKLGADTALLAICSNGAYYAEAPPKSTAFVIVQLMTSDDVAAFDKGRTIENSTYLVKAVIRNDTGKDIAAAAKRIDDVLEDGTLTVTGYTLMRMHREERIRTTEVDDTDPSVRWWHRGGLYRVECAVS